MGEVVTVLSEDDKSFNLGHLASIYINMQSEPFPDIHRRSLTYFLTIPHYEKRLLYASSSKHQSTVPLGYISHPKMYSAL